MTKRPEPAPRSGPRAIPPVEPRGGWIGAWVRFWFSPMEPLSLHVVRFAAGLVVLGWLLGVAGHVAEFLGFGGWFDRQAYREIAALEQGTPAPLGWSVFYLFAGDDARLQAAYWCAVAAVLLFTLGIWTRITGVLSWVAVVSFLANPALAYDGDYILVILAFYLMIGYLGFGLLDAAPSKRIVPWLGAAAVWPLGRRPGAPAPRSVAARVTVRLIQVHFAVIICTSGLHKLQMGDWWSGVALWHALFPPFQTTPDQVREASRHAEAYLVLLSLAGYAVLAWQIGFPLFAWRPGWRLVLLGGALVGWIALAILDQLPLFGPVYLVGCLSFVTPAEWQRLGAWLRLAWRWTRSRSGRKPVSGRAAAPLALTTQR